MKRTVLIHFVAGTAFFLSSMVIGVQVGEAVEAHHTAGAKAASSARAGGSDAGMMAESSPGNGPAMMGRMAGSHGRGGGMMGQDMMGQGMMGMMDQNMMPMMMSHMMGGPGGMGKMMGKMGPGTKGPGGGMGGMAHMLETLDLSADQWDKVRVLARDRLEKMADLWSRRMKLKIALMGLRWDQDVDAKQVKDLFVKKAEIKAEMFLSSLSYMRDLKDILTKEQLKKLASQGF